MLAQLFPLRPLPEGHGGLHRERAAAGVQVAVHAQLLPVVLELEGHIAPGTRPVLDDIALRLGRCLLRLAAELHRCASDVAAEASVLVQRHAKMLVEPDNNLCLKCHAQVATATGQIYIGDQSHTEFLSRGSCWSARCHTAIHGSNIDRQLRY